MKSKLQSLFIVLTLLASLAQTARAAVTFTNTPSAISNTFSGTITLQVTGLTAGDTVVVQKWLDANTNGVIDAGDLLFQQFQLTDGQASVFTNGSTAVTNFNVPGDMDGATNGSITVQLYPDFDFSQLIVGKYLFVLSSPAGHFLPITNSFSVTNFPFAQSFAGNVVSNATSTTISDAVVLLFNPDSNGGPVAGMVANNSGAYTIKVPPGTYELLAVKSNFVADGSIAPFLTLGAGATITTNLTLTNASQSISGKVEDANNSSIGLPGILTPVQTQNGGNGGGLEGLLGIAFTDTNGNFTARVNANQWQVEGNEDALSFHGYLGLQNKSTVDTTGGSVSGVTLAVPKATAVFYGTVKDNFGNPLPGVTAIYSSDNNGDYEIDGYTYTNGNYVAGAIGGLSGDQWQVDVDYSSLTNYVFSQGSDNITLSAGRAYQYNFTAILATNQISGNVKDSDGNPVTGVGVSANATINSVNYNASVDTDDNGNYSFNVCSGDWSVSVNCNGGNDDLDNIYGSGNYDCPTAENISINNDNSNANFDVQLCDGVQVITTSPLPNGQANRSYYNQLEASSCNGNFTWTLNDPADFPSDLNFDTSGEIYGTPTNGGTYSFSVNVADGSGYSANPSYSLTIVAQPVLGSSSWQTNRFQFHFIGVTNQNYTVQTSTNLSSTNWSNLYITNSTKTNSFILTDPNATNKQRFYRVLIGP